MKSLSRKIFFLSLDILLISLAIYLAFLLRFEGKRKGFDFTLGSTIIKVQLTKS